MNITAIILAAGRSTRMDGNPKGLLRLKGVSLLERCVSALSRGGVSDILAITGHRAAEFAPTHDFQLLYNPDFHQGMFSSIQAGLRAAQQGAGSSAVLLLPVDVALVQPHSVQHFLEHWAGEGARKAAERRILIPGILGRVGHPVLVPEAHFNAILNWDGDCGLRGYLASLLPEDQRADFLQGRLEPGQGGKMIRVLPVADLGILSDLDLPEDFARAEAFLAETEDRALPSPEEAWQLLTLSDLEPKKVRHSLLVGLAAYRLATAMNQRGFAASPALCLVAGMLHDLRRQERDHAMRVFEVLSALGWPKAAFVAGCHTILPASYRRRLGIDLHDSGFFHPPVPGADPGLADELFYSTITVYMVDKYAKYDVLVDLSDRFKRIRDWFIRDPELVRDIDRREVIAGLLEKWFAERLWSRTPDIIATPLGDAMELRLKELFEQSSFNEPGVAFYPWADTALRL